MRREISLHGSNPNRLSSSPMRLRRPKPDGAAVAWVLSFSAYSRKLSAALPIARFHPVWDRCAAAAGSLSAASRFRTSTAAFILPAASTFQEVIRRLYGSFQFPTVLALHLYILARRLSYYFAFWAFGWTVQRLVDCPRKIQSAAALKPLAHFWDTRQGMGASLALPSIATVQRLASLRARFLAVVESSMSQCGFTVKPLFAKGW